MQMSTGAVEMLGCRQCMLSVWFGALAFDVVSAYRLCVLVPLHSLKHALLARLPYCQH